MIFLLNRCLEIPLFLLHRLRRHALHGHWQSGRALVGRGIDGHQNGVRARAVGGGDCDDGRRAGRYYCGVLDRSDPRYLHHSAVNPVD